MQKLFLVSYIIINFSSLTMAQKSKQFDEKYLEIKWELLSNQYKNTDNASCAFAIVNNNKTAFPSSGWTIYFNSSRDVESIVSPEGLSVAHVNGDIFKISPTATFKGINSKKETRLEYISIGLSLNYSSAPSGLYIVWDSNRETGFSISNYTIKPLKNTTTGLATPEKIYAQNSTIKDIATAQIPKIFPTPVSYKETTGAFLLSADVSIQSDDLFKKEAGYLVNELEKMIGKKLPLAANNNTGKKIILQKAAMEAEAYQLSVSTEKVTIKASSTAGIFNGIQSLRSLIPAAAWNGIQAAITLPAVEVQDAPRFGYRSLMLDVARNFKSKEDILRILDLMALYKMNVFHLHFSDDEGWRIEIPSLPELTAIGAKRGHTLDSKKLLPASYGAGPVAGKSLGTGFYTRQQFIEILKYANDRHILVIPEIESPGHGRAAIKAMDARYDQFMKAGNKEEAERYLLRDINDQSIYSSAQQWTDNVMCVALPSVYNFIDKVTTELILMYKEAGAPLTTIHLGGDEVPAGAWEKSPICQQLIKDNPELKETNDLWYYYYNRTNKLLQSKGLFLSGWEEVGMRKTVLEGAKTMIVNPRMANDHIQLHVWNNMVGWGAEDLPYRLANAGYKVVLSPVSNNYFDLAYNKSPDEPGYYWGGYEDIDKPFYFIPYDYYKTSKEDAAGNPIDQSYFVGKDRLTDFGKSNIVGIQGLLWNENIRSVELLEYMLLPKLLGVAERAWAKDPEWANAKDKTSFQQMYNDAWSVFVNVLGKQELPRLDYLSGGFRYRIPTAGAMVENGKVLANLQLPGFIIRYTTDGTDPTINSKIYEDAITEKGTIKMKVFNTSGRGSRTITIENN
jgi:hexosaminidase